MIEVRCPKCGLYQDLCYPFCVHMQGRKGALFVLAERGRDFYRKIGAAGGAATAAAPGARDRLREIGRRGGAATKAKKGIDHFVRAGLKGGAVQHARAEAAKIRALLGDEP